MRSVFVGSFLLVCLAGPKTMAEEPGIDVAAPRFAISTVDDATLQFHPANLSVEQGDWVRWIHTSTAQFPVQHTTTQGSSCTPGGLWDAVLLPPSFAQFTRRFLDPPAPIPYYCEPHCFFGMTGQVLVTTPIDLLVNDSQGTTALAWSGGSGSYQVFRSGTPQFTGAETSAFQPAGGATGTTFADATQPAAGRALFYLAMNLF